MRKKALMKDTFSEIRKSLGRFFSIMVIVALGVAFLAGIRVSAPMMRDTTDKYMDDYHMMDVMVLSTLGLEEEDVQALSKLEEVESITGSHSIDTLTDIRGSQLVVKVHSLQALSPEDEHFINKPKLIEGEWPNSPNECLIDGTKLTRLPLNIGDTITLETGTSEAIKDVLENNQYKIVGVINSPYYMHFERGSAEIGNGSVASFIYIPEENFKSDIYTEVFINLKGAEALDSYSDEYTALVDEFKAKAESIVEQRAFMRYEKILREGKADLEEGENKLREEKEKANKELVDAANKLQDAEAEIKNKEQELLEGENKANEGFKQAEVTISKAETILEQKQKEYEEGLALFNSQKPTVQAQLDEAKAKLDAGKNELQNLKVVLQGIEDQLSIAEGQEREQLLGQKQVIEGQIKSLEELLKTNEQAYLVASSEFNQKEQALVAAKAGLDQGRTELKKQKLNLESKKTETTQTLESGKAQLEKAKTSLEEAKQTYETSKAEAEEKIKEAEDKIAKGKTDLENLKEPTVYVLGREANYGVANYASAADTIERIGQVFPIFFFVVAALVCLTTMTRMVDEQRITIGTYKALGYSSIAIMSKYMIYAGIASIIGGLIGIIVGFTVFPNTIYSAYGMAFTAPSLIHKIYPIEAISAIVLMVALTIFAAVFTTIKELKEHPSELMRPKAPAAGKRILLERIPFIWKRMNFFQKVVARNIFRYKKKFFMTTIGIGGCTALLVAGLGLKQSVSGIVTRQYGDIFKYDLEVVVKEDGIGSIEKSVYVEEFLEVNKENIQAIQGKEKRNATLLTLEHLESLPEFINLVDRETREPLNLQDDGVILSEKLAKALQVNVGDYIKFEDNDLNAYEVKVIGITENYIGHYMYMTDVYAKQVKGTVPKVNQLLIRLKDSEKDNTDAISNDLTQNEAVTSFAFMNKNAENFESMTASLDTVVIILIIAAALLAFVVLYNLTTINISERYREIATIKVLGFNDFKVSQYIYRENLVLTLMGALFGLLLGKILFLFIIVTAEMDELMFGRELYASSYIVAVILTFVFSMLVNLMMHFKLQKIEMVESLKSVE